MWWGYPYNKKPAPKYSVLDKFFVMGYHGTVIKVIMDEDKGTYEYVLQLEDDRGTYDKEVSLSEEYLTSIRKFEGMPTIPKKEESPADKDEEERKKMMKFFSTSAHDRKKK